MKTIYFIRHAKSDQKTDIKDFDRVLNKRGKGDARLMAQRLKHYEVKPDLVISSPAKRALITINTIIEALNYPKKNIIMDKGLYFDGEIAYLDAIHNIDDEHNRVFIVGHNPFVTQICEYLTNSIIGNIPTCGIFCIGFDVTSFKEIKEASGKVLFFDLPKKHIV